MIGSQSDPGIMVRVMGDLFVHSATQGKQQGVNYRVSVSFLEVYNENIRDLLSDTEDYLDLREDPIKGPVVAGITEVEANSGDEIMQLLHQVMHCSPTPFVSSPSSTSSAIFRHRLQDL